MFCLECGCKIELGAKFCAHCGKPTQLGNSSSMGKINVVRENKFYGCAIPFDIYVDNTLLGTLNNGTTLSCNVTLTTHEIVLKSTEKDVIQNVELNESQKEVTLTIVAKSGWIAAKPSIKNIKYN